MREVRIKLQSLVLASIMGSHLKGCEGSVGMTRRCVGNCLRSTSLDLALFLVPYDLTPPLCNLPAFFYFEVPELLLMALVRHKSSVLALLLVCALLQLNYTGNLIYFMLILSLLYRIHIKKSN